MKPSSNTNLWLRPLGAAGLATILAFGLTACKSNTTAPITNAAAGPDAADGNLAPVSGDQPTQVLGQSASYQPQQQGETYTDGQQPPAPIEQGYANNAPDQNDAYNNQDVADYADQAPPPLPDYDQPPAPDPNYIWTPGYWAYGPEGYYWAPGVWCPPPYYGALWTPPYWGFYGGRYGFHHGYWGLHIGFYGGVDYGFGYIGTGYFGGYWHGNDFYYNRSVTNVNFRTNVYERPVVYNNVTYGRGIQNRVSYNGGQGGIRVAPRPAEVVAMHENHVGPIAAQTQVRTEASQNRAQFFNNNHGRPAKAAFARPTGVPAGAPHIAEAPAAVRQEQQRSVAIQQHNVQAQQQRTAAPENRPGVAPQQQRGVEPNRAAEPQQQRAVEPNRAIAPQQQQRAVEPQRVAPQQQQQRAVEPQRAAPQQQQQRAVEPQRVAPQPQQRAVEPQRAAPQPQQRAPEPQRAAPPQARPEAAAPRPAPEARPAPAPRAAAPAPRPAPAAHAAPPPHEEPHR